MEWQAGQTQKPEPVQFPEDFTGRVASLQLQLGTARQSREGAGNTWHQGVGGDLVGFRPYRPGEDLRQLDWNLLARLDKPFVRVTRREAGELWVVAVDSSASMGVGPPMKLQRAAECAVALWSMAAQSRVQVRLLLSSGDREAPKVFEAPASRNLAPAISFYTGQRAAGKGGLQGLLRLTRLFRGASRVFCLGDLLDESSAGGPLREILELRRSVGELNVLQLLAPTEFEPPLGAVEWWDPESEERLKMEVGNQERLSYQALLDERLEVWRELSGKHRFGFSARSTNVPFEDLTRQWVQA